MDTHISELAREQDRPENRVRARVFLPGEAGARRAPLHEPPGLEEGEAAMTADPAERLTPLPPVRRHRRRTWLLATAAVFMVAGAGAGFLLSPYNTVFYPVDAARLRTQGQKLASAASTAVADIVAPSARVARAPQPVQLPPAQRQVVAIPSSDDQMREILALRDRTQGDSGIASGSPTAPATASSTVPRAITAQASSPTLGAPSRVAPPPPAAAPLPVLAQIPAGGPRAIPAAVAARQPDPFHPLSLPPLAVLETGATPAPPPALSSAVGPSQAALTISEATSSAAAAPAVLPPANPAIVSATAPNSPSGQDLEPAPPIHGVPAPATNAAPTQTAPVLAVATQPARIAPASRSLSTPSEVVAAATELHAAPMTPVQQVEVLNLVAMLGVVVRDMRAENASLKSRVESTADRFDAAVIDFDRRLALAEAKGAVNAAMGAFPAPTAPAPEAAPSPVRSARAGAGTVSTVQIIPIPNTAAPSGSAAPRYRVTAASPGLAMLSLLDRSGGEGSQLQVAVGDPVPGYGRVTAIQQRGSAWIVQTDKGPDKGAIQ